ncbi:MAG: chromosome partitioning protein ParA, partial [bacterium]
DEEIDKRVETERKLITEKYQALEKEEKELEHKEQRLEQLWHKRNDQLNEEVEKRVETERKLVTEKLQALEKREKELENKEQRLEQLWHKRNDQLDQEVENRVEDKYQIIIADLKDLKYRNHYLSERNNTQSQLIAAFEHLQLQLDGQNPADVIKELNSKTEEIKNLQNEISTRPVVEIERYKDLKKERDRLHARNEKLLKENQENAEILQQANEDRLKVHNLINENQVLKQIAERMEGAANEAHEELRRLRAAYASPSEIKARHKEIEEPHIKMEKIGKPCKEETLDENVWLTGIEQKCNEYGLHFHPRILRAFHTALKTAEWSPITVLAGVSGTGKSELPRLYSHFGGLLFHPISVQPNWDSQESMLGFFNSIENKFDAQPVLRFLAQSQKEWDIKDEYPGLQEFLCLILLDEMNLAHPELYFAEFLSKLELRRGMKRKDVPILPVKIGSGMEAYPLPLGRNVLWTGTMNQDETTKSLSDKVLDRSIIIYFPRPKELKRRTELKALDEENRGLLMKRNIWEKWLSKESKFKDEEIKPFKDFVEDMNESLAVVGRAIGHRVWQSVEYYMMNYPDVRAARNEKDKNALNKALHTAFEDQLVQKIMPKLRGIDTRGKSKTECLDKILEQINRGIGGNPFNLREDFNLACELGYGQFIWQSANYLKEESTQIFENTDEKITEVTKKTSKAKKRAK